MKRWNIKTEHEELQLYYPSIEKAMLFPGAVSAEEINDKSHEQYIHQIIDNGTLVHRRCNPDKNSERFIYRIETQLGYILARIYRDPNDGSFYDFAEYVEHHVGQLVQPILWDCSTPKDVALKYIHSNPVRFLVYSERKYGEPKLSKPKDLTGKKQDFSVLFCNRCKCGCFINKNDLWIKHRDLVFFY